jgi:hypothetical protein
MLAARQVENLKSRPPNPVISTASSPQKGELLGKVEKHRDPPLRTAF